MSSGERFWTSRVRWRLRGALMWPAFAVVTLAEAVLLNRLPPIRTGVDLIPGAIIATFANLILVGAVAPWLAKRMAARSGGHGAVSPQTAREVLQDRVGTVLLATGLVGVIASGLATRPLIVGETEERERAAKALFEYVQHSGNAELRRNNDAAETARLADGYFRTCIPHDDRRRYFCFFVDATKQPVEVVRDPSAQPNSRDPGR